MGNILDAIISLKNAQNLYVADGESGNSIQIVGSGLEGFVKSMFSDAINDSIEAKKAKYNFSLDYTGNANNPPDIILKGGDAIEVKKVDSLTGDVQLNSSPPKAKLLASDTRINKTCRELAKRDNWTEKDIIYSIGSLTKEKKLRRLWLVYGDCFAADHDIYESASQRVKDALNMSFEKTELGDTNELGSIPRIDPLGITRLRVRGMWIIKNPSKVFEEHVDSHDKNAIFQSYCLMKETKYQSFDKTIRERFESSLDSSLRMKTIKIHNPNNPVELVDARLISYVL
jgi:hypothetical protein